MNTILITIMLSILPISELRGAIPYALSRGLDPISTFIITVIPNILIILPILFFLTYLHKYFMNWEFYRKLFVLYLNRVRNKAAGRMQVWPYLALFFFVAIPFPGTGAYTGCLITWFFKLRKRKAIPVMSLAVFCAGLVVTFITLGVINSFF